MAGVIYQSKIIEGSSIPLFTLAKQINNGQNIGQNMTLLQTIAVKMSQSSTSLPDAQLDPFREAFKPDSLPDSLNSLDPLSDSREIPDSQESSESTTIETSRDDRIAIQTALKLKIPHSRIREVLGVTERQIYYAKNHRITPQKSKTGRKPLLRTPQRNRLEQWLLESLSH